MDRINTNSFTDTARLFSRDARPANAREGTAPPQEVVQQERVRAAERDSFDSQGGRKAKHHSRAERGANVSPFPADFYRSKGSSSEGGQSSIPAGGSILAGAAAPEGRQRPGSPGAHAPKPPNNPGSPAKHAPKPPNNPGSPGKAQGPQPPKSAGSSGMKKQHPVHPEHPLHPEHPAQSGGPRPGERPDRPAPRPPDVEQSPSTSGVTPAAGEPAVGLPFTYALDTSSLDNGSITSTTGPSVKNAIEAAIGAINEAAGQTLINPTLETSDTGEVANDGINVISFAPSEYSIDEGVIAESLSYLDEEGKVTGADIVFNPGLMFSTDASGETEQSTLDIQGIITHELLHTLSLDHNTVDPSSVMRPETAMTDDTEQRTLASGDIAGLQALYPGASA